MASKWLEFAVNGLFLSWRETIMAITLLTGILIASLLSVALFKRNVVCDAYTGLGKVVS